MMDDAYWAKEAARLLQDATLLEAVSRAQQDAMMALVDADVDDKTGMLRLQSQVKAYDEILSVLEAMIIKSAKPESPAVP